MSNQIRRRRCRPCLLGRDNQVLLHRYHRLLLARKLLCVNRNRHRLLGLLVKHRLRRP